MMQECADDEYEDEFDYLDESSDEMDENQMLSDVMEASNQQAMMAIELTKVVVSKMGDLTEDKVFEIFKKASNLILEGSPLKMLFDKN